MNGYIAGIITGLILAVLNAILLKREDVRVENIVRGVSRRIRKSEKAEFLAPDDLKIDALEQIFEENNKQGIDTELKEI